MTALDKAVNRLARNMAIAQVSLQQGPSAALFSLSVDALSSAIEDVKQLLAETPADRRINVSSRLIGPHVANALADSLVPVTPNSWKEE